MMSETISVCNWCDSFQSDHWPDPHDFCGELCQECWEKFMDEEYWKMCEQFAIADEELQSDKQLSEQQAFDKNGN